MALTRVISETVIVDRVGPLMSAAGMAVTVVGTNADLNDPLAWAARKVGATTANFNTVTDAELAAISDADGDDFLDLAEYRTLGSIMGNLDDVDITAGPRSESLSQLAEQARKRMEALEAHLSSIVSPFVAGYITLDFAEHSETRID